MAESHAHPDRGGRTLILALAVTLGFAAVEAFAGWLAGSLALLGDAGHMLTDSVALGLAAAAARLARRPPSFRLSYGLARVEVLAALANAGFMFALVLGLGWQALHRLLETQPVDGELVAWVAAIGLLVNVAVAWILLGGERDLNTRAALLHVIGDALGSVAALSSGLAVAWFGWTRADPLLSLFICGLILFSTLRLAGEAIRTLLEGVPTEISLPQVGRRMAGVGGVVSVHDLHIWSVSSRLVALTAHVVVADLAAWQAILADLSTLLREEFAIEHVTLQPEVRPASAVRLTRMPPAEARRR
ncbi:MAG TPA: cation diffusion facilitator family transporter [Rhodocyclaceae bacterium]|nr:cation diffusion facilitator family transporter [Rhodocyclaceae bacterium]